MNKKDLHFEELKLRLKDFAQNHFSKDIQYQKWLQKTINSVKTVSEIHSDKENVYKEIGESFYHQSQKNNKVVLQGEKPIERRKSLKTCKKVRTNSRLT